MPTRNEPFSIEECGIIRDGWASRATLVQIASQLNLMPNHSAKPRTRFSIHKFVLARGLKRPLSALSLRTQRRHAARLRKDLAKAQSIAGDTKFKLAMLSARRTGAEHITLGVFRDHRPFALSSFHAEPTRSFTGSQAALCVES